MLTEINYLLLSFVVFILAALSLTAGQSVVLFANRVPPSRFLLSVWASVLSLTLTAVGQFIFLAVALPLTTAVWTWLELLVLVLLSDLPYLLGFLVFLPYLGNPILRLLRLAEGLIFFVGLYNMGATGLSTAVVVLAMLIGTELWRHLPFFDPDLILDRLWLFVTGRPAPEKPAVLVEHLLQTGQFYQAPEAPPEEQA